MVASSFCHDRKSALRYLKPGLHVSSKDRKHMVGNVYFKIYGYGLLFGMIASFEISQETFSIDILTASKSSLKHRHKHVLQSLLLYGDQALNEANGSQIDIIMTSIS